MRIDGDVVKFRNGREEYANCGIIGIGDGAYDDELVTSGGYDNGLPVAGEPLLKVERQELAAYMIEKWAKFGAKEVIN
jgi:hypothetical protein